MLNGTLREFDTRFMKKYCSVRLVLWNIVDRQNPDHEKPRCQNCAATTHKTWECSEAKKISPEIVCDNCGNAGHPTFDCKVVQSMDRYLFSLKPIDQVGRTDISSDASNPQSAKLDQE